MSDELDPELSRCFAEANQPLPDAEFHARLIGRLQQPYGWSALSGAVIRGSRAALAGLAVGIAAPFRLRFGHIGLMTVSAAALAIWATLQSA
jgi:hypothetical protein